DLVRMQAIYWDMETQGMKFEYRDIPANLQAQADEYRAKMIEAAAEANDALMNKYLEGEELSAKEIRAGLRERSIKNEIVLCMCGTAFKNKGVQALLDAVIDRKSTRLNSSHRTISYAVFCLKKKKKTNKENIMKNIR